MHLTAMMGLVIEHMGDEKPLWLGELALGTARIPSQVAVEPRLIKAIRPVDDHGVESLAFAAQGFPFWIERYRFGNAPRRSRHVGKPAHPDAIAPQKVAQRLVDRPKERGAFTPAFILRQPVRDAVEVFVLPTIVARHALNVGWVDHSPIRPLTRLSPSPRWPQMPPARGSRDRTAPCGR